MKKLMIVAALALFASPSLFAAVDMFMKIDGVAGESQDQNHKDWIELTGFNFGVSHGTMAQTGAGMRVGTNSVTIRARGGMWQPQIMSAVSSGRHFQSVTVDVGTQRYLFKNAVFSSASLNGNGNQGPEESMTLNYAQVEITYAAQKPEVAPRTAVVASMVVPNAAPPATPAQLSVDGLPGEQFGVLNVQVRGNTA
ncbi:MAG TPA: type VI secretion system tube protein Hcp, partial [Thermoanaerobaculia bacterium]|nr:type VI secretion system tube protein Hcp [Thermoanaerobaculia bacterium]